MHARATLLGEELRVCQFPCFRLYLDRKILFYERRKVFQK